MENHNIVDLLMPDNVKTVNEKKDIYINKYPELKEYIFIKNTNELKIGHRIRYVDYNDKLRWGGLLIKIIENKLVIANKNKNYFHVDFERNYIFMKKPVTKNDKMRKLFMSSIGFTDK